MLRRKYKVFFAIPFDAATFTMYQDIKRDLKKGFDEHFLFLIGTETVGEPLPDYSDVDQFKAQNQDFLTRFSSVIGSSDIVIADLTNNNPSVHIELGIALTLNKNILRVSGRDLITTATDLNGYEVNRYEDKRHLLEKIIGYLDFYWKIKTRQLSDIPLDLTELSALRPPDAPLTPYVALPHPIDRKLRDGEIRLQFEFTKVDAPQYWFGALLRAESSIPWLGGGYFVYVRQNGELVVSRMPTTEKLKSLQMPRPLGLYTYLGFHIIFDGDQLFASVDDGRDGVVVEVDGLDNQSPGVVTLACHGCEVSFQNVKLANRDAIAFPQVPVFDGWGQ